MDSRSHKEVHNEDNFLVKAMHNKIQCLCTLQGNFSVSTAYSAVCVLI